MRRYLLLFPIIFLSFSIQAQVINTFLNRHGKEDSIEVVTIGKRMLDRMQSDSLATPELQKAIEGLENIRIVFSRDKEINKDYYRSAYELVYKADIFKEVLSVDNGDEILHILIKETKGVINELILLSNNSKDFYLISLKGNIQLDVLAGYSEDIGVKGLEKRNNIQ